MTEEGYINILLHNLKTLEEDANKYDEQSLLKMYEDSIKMLLPSPIKIKDSLFLYRARLAETVTKEQPITSVETFSYMPLRYNKENLPKRGRMNLTGESIFYASSLPQTNFREIKKEIKEGDEVYLSKWELKSDSVMSTFSVIMSSKISESVNSETDVCITDSHIVNGPIGEYLRYFSDMLLKDEDVEEKKYLLTSFIAYNIFRINGKYIKEGESFPLYYDAIAYPSVQSMNCEYNWAIRPEFVDEHIQMKYVVKGVLKADLQSVDFRCIGFYNDNEIIWYELKVFPDDVEFDSCCFWDDENKKYISSEYNLKDLTNKDVSLLDIRNLFEIRKNRIIEEMTSQRAFAENLSYEDIIDESSLIKYGTYQMYIPVKGWTIEVDNEKKNISKIGASLIYKTGLERLNV